MDKNSSKVYQCLTLKSLDGRVPLNTQDNWSRQTGAFYLPCFDLRNKLINLYWYVIVLTEIWAGMDKAS
jgi:hypothetical protein